MQQLRKYTICCILLAVQVQVAFCIPSPRIFSSRSVYSNSDKGLPGAFLKDAKFKVIFSEAIDETTFDKSDISVYVDSDIDTTTASVVTIKSLTKTSDMHWEFDLEDNRDTIPTPSSAVTHVKFHIAAEKVSTASNEQNFASNKYEIRYASEFIFTSIYKELPEGTGSIQWDLHTTRDSHVVGHSALPFKVCHGDGDCTDGELMSSALLNGAHIAYKLDHAKPGNKYCLVGNVDDATTSIIADYFGNFIDAANLPDLCVDIAADPCAYVWSDWSDCTYNCVPTNSSDIANNVKTRHEIFSEPDVCEKTPRVESKPCDEEYQLPCKGRIFGGETGDECTCGSDPENTYQTASTCRCGGNCVEEGNCCQSYYKKCVEDNDHPKYAYLYFPCWQPQTCNTDDTRPSCSSTRRGTTSFGGQCNGRPYSYNCMCSVERFKCFQYSYVDQCCGGEDNYRATCGYEKID